MRAHFVLLAPLAAFLVVASCSSSSDKRKVHVDYSSGGASGGEGTNSEAGMPTQNGSGAPASNAGAPTENGGAVGASGGSGDAGASGAGGAGGVDLATCSTPDDACCAAGQCGAGLNCVGSVCSCIASIANDVVIRTDGRVVSINSNDKVQTPVLDQTTGKTIIDVVAAKQGPYHGCALKSDNTVWCWPRDASVGNNSGQLGNGAINGTLSPYQAAQVRIDPGGAPGPLYLTGVQALATHYAGIYDSTTCALKKDGSIWCWGSDGADGNDGLVQNAPNSPYAKAIKSSASATVLGAEQVVVGGRHACFVKAGGVWCWSATVGLPLGEGSGNPSPYPLQAGPAVLSSVTKIGAGSDTTCALIGGGTEAGAVYCWGDNRGHGPGGLGIGDPATTGYSKLAPTRVRVSSAAYLTGAVDLIVTQAGGCAMKSDRSLWCWGTDFASAPTADYATAWSPNPANTPVENVYSATPNGGALRYLLGTGEYVIGGASISTLGIGCGLLD